MTEQREDQGAGMTETEQKDPGRLSISRALLSAGISGRIERELPGGASTRRFFRVSRDDKPSLIGMFVPAPSQEIRSARQVSESASFVEMQQLLAANGIPVPDIVSHQPAHRALLVEDLGDDTLAEYLFKEPDAAEELYKLAVADLARAQRALADCPEATGFRKRAFDESLLRWEVEHFRDWALEARGIHLSPSETQVFDDAATALSAEIGGWPRGFVHRDFQSRNLMVRAKEGKATLTWIDFQDAMLGPRAYDLVALLMDSYQRFGRDFIIKRIGEYARATDAEAELDRLLFEFDLITVQRKLKDAGRFIFVAQKNGNNGFLKYVDSTIHRARSALARVAESDNRLQRLGELLHSVLGPLDAKEPTP